MLPRLLSGTRVVFIDRPPGNIQADAVLLDSVGGAPSEVEHLLAHGHRRIAFIGDEPSTFTATERLRGYREALRRAGVALDESSLVKLGAHDADTAKRFAHELLALPEPPTALFTGNNRVTVGALCALRSTTRPNSGGRRRS